MIYKSAVYQMRKRTQNARRKALSMMPSPDFTGDIEVGKWTVMIFEGRVMNVYPTKEKDNL